MNKQVQTRWFGWWYVCIGLGFAALALRSYVAGARAVPIILRLVIAAGFLALGAGTLRGAMETSDRR